MSGWQTTCSARLMPLPVPVAASAFLVETARETVKRRKLLAFLESDEVAWKDEDHPELANGSGAWVRALREESEIRRGTKRKRNRRPK